MKGRYKVRSPIRSIRISSYGKSGRARFLKIKHAGGELVIRASHFRLSLGPETIRSTFISELKKSGDGYLFRGKGWGHGVGLCQEGARGMAAKKSKYKKIVSFYYPGAKISEWED